MKEMKRAGKRRSSFYFFLFFLLISRERSEQEAKNTGDKALRSEIRKMRKNCLDCCTVKKSVVPLQPQLRDVFFWYG